VKAAAPLPAAAPAESPGERWWGVIVGVGEYQNLDPSLALDGPANDVPLVTTWLQRQGVPRRHLTVLADRVAHADGLPTRAAILGALQALPARMRDGDIAFLYFAGHGSLEPEGGSQWSKADGEEEIFLPRDVGRWDGASGRVRGAILDHEIGRAVEALRTRGIFVWLVFDSCHSATIARALPLPNVRSRGVPPATLGVPATARFPEHAGDAHDRDADAHDRDGAHAGEGAAARLVRVQGAALAGGYVAFYAAQTVESAPELPLPAGEPGRQVHGLFTYALLKALAATGAGSYREVAHRILAFYASTYPATTPEFEGALDGPIGAPSAPLLAPSAWPAQRSGARFRIESGRLSGVTPDTLLALYAPIPAATTDLPRGLLRVTEVTLTNAWAQPIADPQQLRAWNIPADRSEELASGVVRVLRTSLDTTIRVAGPASCFASLPAPYACGSTDTAPAWVEKARRLVLQAGCLPPGAALTSDVGAADLLLWVSGRRLLLALPSTMSPERSVGVDLDSQSAAEDLQHVLFKATRAIAITRLAAEFDEPPHELLAELRMHERTGRWLPIGDRPSRAVPFGTELSIELQNTGPDDMDVTILAIDDRFGIVPVYPVDQESNLLRKGSARVQVSGWARTPGDNSLVFIVEKARTGQPHDLGYLAQPGVGRHSQDNGLPGLLERFGFSPRGTRSSVSQDDLQSASIKLLHYAVAGGS
jgi:hypothetical protein